MSSYDLGFQCGKEDLKNYGFGSDILSALTSLKPEYKLDFSKWQDFAQGYIDGSNMKKEHIPNELHRVRSYIQRIIQKGASMKPKQILVLSQQFLNLVRTANNPNKKNEWHMNKEIKLDAD